MRKCVALLLCIMCIAMMMPAAGAETADTTLEVSLYGMTLLPSGEWKSEALSGAFSVYQNGANVGKLTVNSFGSTRLTLASGDEVTLIPEAGSMPKGYRVEEDGYTLSITGGIRNTAHIIAYSDSGLFTVYADGEKEFTVTRAGEEEAYFYFVNDAFSLRFKTSKDGVYSLQEPIPVDDYVLTDVENGNTIEFSIASYRGNPRDITVIDTRADAAQAVITAVPEIKETEAPTAAPTEIPTEEPTATPTAEPTATPTAVPTATPTAVPTATPTAVPTATPTAVPTATPTAVPTATPTAEPTATPTAEPTATPTAEPTATPTAEPTATPTAEPTATPTAEPTATPTAEPTATPTAEPTATPTAEPTATPTAEPTATPTAEPTATPTVEPTATPTAEPTEEPTPETAENEEVNAAAQEGNVALAFVMPEEAEAVEYLIYQNDVVLQSGKCSDSQTVAFDLPEGRYKVQINLPSSLYLESVIGQEIKRSGKLAWFVDAEDSLFTYDIVIGKLLSLQGHVNHIPDGARVSVTGGEGSKQTKVADGFYRIEGLIPSNYVVTMNLGEGEYTGEQWEFISENGQMTAQMNITLAKSEELPAVSKAEEEIAEEPFAQETQAPSETTVNTAAEDTQKNTAQEETASTHESVDPENTDWSQYAVYSLIRDDAEKLFIPLRSLPHKDVSGTASIEVHVFNDANHNGECGPYETDIANAEIDLILTGDEEAIVASTITGADGMAIFTDLPAGDYIVRSSLPVYYGYGEKGKYKDLLSTNIMRRQSAQNQESAPIHVDVDQTYHVGIGATKACGFSGQVWLDDGDGVRQETEPGQAGVLVEMIGLHNGLTYQLITGEDGTFNFTQLRYGNYKFKVTLPDGFMFTSESRTGGSNRSIFTSEGKSTAEKNIIYDKTRNISEQNVGVVSEGSIYGTAFKDYNYNGIYDAGDEPLADVKLTVFRGNSGIDYGTIKTGADGTFSFNALRSNTYRITASLPKDGAFYTIVGTGEDANQFSSRTRDAVVSNVTVHSGESVKVNLGALYYASISGTTYYDTNFNGAMDPGEEVIPNLTVSLIAQDGSVADTVKTSRKGTYSFDNVFPGSYSIFVKAVDGYAFTRLGDDNIIVSRGNGEGSSELIQIVMGETYSGMNAGLVQPGIVTGVFYGDANDNGVQDPEEKGLENANVRLVNEETGETYSLTMSEAAAYRFDAVLPGTYHVEITIPENAVFVDQLGDWTADGLTVRSPSFSMNSGEQKSLDVIGGLTLGSITGTAFENPAADGVWNDGSKGMEGLSIALMTTDGKVYAHAETGKDGYFEIRDIRPATYLLSINIPDGKVLARKANVTLPIESCKETQTVPLTVKMGDIYFGQMLGCVTPGTLAGDAWLDENTNGKWDDGERPASGEVIYVYDLESGINLATLTTDSNGQFSNAGMIPGSYRLVYIPDSLTISAPEGETSFTSLSGQLMTQPITLEQGQEITDFHLGLMRYTDIHGAVWFDQGGTIEALPGAMLSLLDKDGHELQNAVSSADGTYTFSRLLPALYEITVTLPEGHVVVEPEDARMSDGTLKSVMQYVNRRNGSTGQFELKMGDDLSDMDIGGVTPGMLGDFLWVDVNENGLQDSGELGVPNVTIHLLRNEKEIASTETDQYGYYRFTDLYPSAYVLQPELPAEVKPTMHRSDLSGIVSVLESEGYSVPVSVISNAANYDADMGVALVNPGVYPAGYGKGATQDWTK